jgi:hypothetical protein
MFNLVASTCLFWAASLSLALTSSTVSDDMAAADSALRKTRGMRVRIAVVVVVKNQPRDIEV